MAGDGGLTFHGLRNVRLDKFGEAAEEWRVQVWRLEDLRDLKDDLVGSVRNANWEGENAEVTRPFVEEQGEQFEAALKQARSLAAVCEDGYQRLRGYKSDLETVVSDAEARGLTVTENGTVSHPFGNLGVTGGEGEQYAEDVAATDAEIGTILRSASEADAAIAQALRDIAGDDPHHFNPVEYASLNDAERAYRDAQAAIALAEQGEDLTDEQLAELNRLLEAHSDDPAFAENVALGLGAEGTLQFWSEVTASRDIRPDSDEWRLFRDLQQSLGQTLGLATRSDSQNMTNWEHTMVSLGDGLVGSDGSDFPFGFQAMSSLLQYGTYDEEFLVSYGNALVSAEQEDPRFRPETWGTSAPSHRLNFSAQNDPGLDPMIGLMDALGHSPDASTQFFGVEENFDYLTQDRNWPADYVGGQGATVQDSDAGYAALGDALVAATTGISSGEWNGEDLEEALAANRRTPETAHVMEQVIEMFGMEEPNLIHEHPTLGDDLGLMGAAYIDDIDYVMSGIGDSIPEESAVRFPTTYGGHIENGKESVIGFLSVLGQDEEAHAIVTQAQTLYTLGNLDRFDPAADMGNYAHGAQSLVVGAEVQRVLDDARVTQVAADFGADAEEAQEALAQSEEWRSTITGVTLGAGATAAAAPFVGPYGVVIAPIVAEAGSEFLGTYLDQVFGSDSDHAREAAEMSRLSASDYYTQGAGRLGDMAIAYNELAEQVGVDQSSRDSLRNDVAQAYPVGNAESGQLPSEERVDR